MNVTPPLFHSPIASIRKDEGLAAWLELEIRESQENLEEYHYLLYDKNSGYQGLVVNNKCYLGKRDGYEPYIFPLSNTINEEEEFLVCMISNPNNNKIGLVAVNQYGHLKYWKDVESVGMLNNYEDCLEFEMALNEDETIEYMLATQHHGILLNSNKEIYFISLMDTHQKFEFKIYSLSSTLSSSITSKIGSLFGFNNEFPLSNVNALTFQIVNSDCLVHVAINNSSIFTFQLDLVHYGKPTFIKEYKMDTNINDIQQYLSIYRSNHIGIVDMCCTSNNALLILVDLDNTHLVLISLGLKEDGLEFNGFRKLNWNWNFELMDSPQFKLLAPHNSDGVIVVNEAAMLITIDILTPEQYFIPMKIGEYNQLMEVNDILGKSSNTLATLNTGFITIDWTPLIANSTEDGYRSTSSFNVSYSPYKNILNQAIQFGFDENNPIDFIGMAKQAGRNVDVFNTNINDILFDLMELGSEANDDIKSIIVYRKDFIFNLVQILKQTGLIESTSVKVKNNVLYCGQKVESALALYNHYELRNKEGDKIRACRLLSDTIKSLYQHVGNNLEIPAFFMGELDRIPDVLKRLFKQVARRYNPNLTKMSLGDSTLLVYELNCICLKTVNSFVDYYDEIKQLLLLDSNDINNTQKNWDDLDNVELIKHLIDLTLKILNQHLNQHDFLNQSEIVAENDMKIIDLVNQPVKLLASLKYQLFDMMRLLLVISKKLRTINNKIENGIKNCYLGLLKLGFKDELIDLLEEYGWFSVLALDVTIFKENGIYGNKLKSLYSKHKEPFLKAVFDQLIHTNNYGELLEISTKFSEFAKDYLQNEPKLLWFLNVLEKKLDQASNLLLNLAKDQQHLLPRKIYYSLGKLAMFCNPLSELDKQKVDVIDDQLDIILVHEQLEQLLNENMKRHQIKLTHPLSIESIEPLFPHILSKPVRSKQKYIVEIFKKAILDVMLGKKLELEMLVDVLTLKINVLDARESGFVAHNGFELALEMLRRMDASVSDEGFNYSLKTLWRRVILFDNWDTIDKEEEEYGEQQMHNRLYHTALYSMVIIVMDLNPNYLFSPNNCLYSGDVNYLQNRFHTLDSEHLNLLLNDYLVENTMLLSYLENNRLNYFYGVICELVSKDLGIRI